MNLAENIRVVKERIDRAAIKSGRSSSEIMLVAVSKTVDIDIISQAYELGLRNFGENRVQELKLKQQKLSDADWHMIGRLQTNKVKDVVGNLKLIHSMDRWNLAEELNRRGKHLGLEVAVLLQVNVSGEKQKAGICPADVDQFLKSAGELKYLNIQGFMTMAPLVENPEEVRPIFRELFELKKHLSKNVYHNVQLQYLSMGMSQDYEIAIEEGANIVRVGTAIFNA